MASVHVALVGGTGDIGQGLALRLGRDTDHTVAIGSRDPEKATARADEYAATLAERGVTASIPGDGNAAVVDGADVAILSVPPFYIEDTVEEIAPALEDGTILVSPAVGMNGDEDGLHYHPPSVGSVAELVAAAAPDATPVVCAFTNLSAERLSDLDDDADQDTLVVGDVLDAKATIRDLAGELQGIRALDAGPLANAAEVESLTALLINAARYNDDLERTGIRLV